jgi:hypothetical protein
MIIINPTPALRFHIVVRGVVADVGINEPLPRLRSWCASFQSIMKDY